MDWISTGHLTDSFDEFLVKEDTSITMKQLLFDFTDDYWERRYTVGPLAPPFGGSLMTMVAAQLRDGTTIIQAFRGQAPSVAGAPVPRKGTEADPRLPGGACVPRFLEPWKHKILLAGKYLNVLRECGAQVGRGEGETAAGADGGAEAPLGWAVWKKEGMVDLEDEK